MSNILYNGAKAGSLNSLQRISFFFFFFLFPPVDFVMHQTETQKKVCPFSSKSRPALSSGGTSLAKISSFQCPRYRGLKYLGALIIPITRAHKYRFICFINTCILEINLDIQICQMQLDTDLQHCGNFFDLNENIKTYSKSFNSTYLSACFRKLPLDLNTEKQEGGTFWTHIALQNLVH